jgi:hypothetical protein
MALPVNERRRAAWYATLLQDALVEATDVPEAIVVADLAFSIQPEPPEVDENDHERFRRLAELLHGRGTGVSTTSPEPPDNTATRISAPKAKKGGQQKKKGKKLWQMYARWRELRQIEAEFSIMLAARNVGDVWRGPSGRRFTKREDGRVVPYKGPEEPEYEHRRGGALPPPGQRPTRAPGEQPQAPKTTADLYVHQGRRVDSEGNAYTGEVKDKAGRRTCYNSGVRVACPRAGQQMPAPPSTRPTVEDVLKAAAEPKTPERLGAIATMIAQMRVQELQGVRKGLEIPYSRKMEDLVASIRGKLGIVDAAETVAPPQEKAPAPPAAKAPSPPAPPVQPPGGTPDQKVLQGIVSIWNDSGGHLDPNRVDPEDLKANAEFRAGRPVSDEEMAQAIKTLQSEGYPINDWKTGAQSPAQPAAPAQQPSSSALAQAFQSLAEKSHGLVSLADLQEATGWDTQTLHREVEKLLRDGTLSGQQFEGGPQIPADQRQRLLGPAMTDEGGRRLAYVQAKTPSPSAPPAPPTKTPQPDYVGKPIEYGEGQFYELQRQYKELQAGYADYYKGLSPDTKYYIRNYQGAGYRALNDAMRQCPPKFDCVSGMERDQMLAIQEAIDNAPPLPEPVTVWRGIRAKPETVAALLAQAKGMVGKDMPYQMPSFTSTTLNPERATGFTETDVEQGRPQENKPLLFRVVARTGLPFDPADWASAEEEELLQGPKSRYRVVGAEEGVPLAGIKGDEQTVIYLEEVPSTAPTGQQQAQPSKTATGGTREVATHLTPVMSRINSIGDEIFKEQRITPKVTAELQKLREDWADRVARSGKQELRYMLEAEGYTLKKNETVKEMQRMLREIVDNQAASIEGMLS